MYTPRHFAETDPTILRDAIRQIRAGELITYGADGLEASFVPMLISDDAATVTGHLAKANGQWQRADLSVPALITWVGPDAYVSPTFYPSKEEDGRVVPTWNFTAVQAKGALVLHHEDEWKHHHVKALTEVHERRLPSPWSVDDAPADFIVSMVKAIVGMEIRITSLVGKWKLSQNRPRADVAGVISGLESYGAGSREARVAKQMAEVAVAAVAASTDD
jgi:transcriptional regulator